MPRKLIGMPQFCIYDSYSACEMLILSFHRCRPSQPLALDYIGAFVSSPLYQGRRVV